LPGPPLSPEDRRIRLEIETFDNIEVVDDESKRHRRWQLPSTVQACAARKKDETASRKPGELRTICRIAAKRMRLGESKPPINTRPKREEFKQHATKQIAVRVRDRGEAGAQAVNALSPRRAVQRFTALALRVLSAHSMRLTISEAARGSQPAMCPRRNPPMPSRLPQAASRPERNGPLGHFIYSILTARLRPVRGSPITAWSEGMRIRSGPGRSISCAAETPLGDAA
jgi:hypothetical protein